MKRFLFGLLSAVIVLASIFGASSKGPRERRPAPPDSRSDQALWV